MNETQEANHLVAEEDPQAIAELFKAWCATFNAQDLTELRSYYPSDAVMMPPNAPSIHGPANIVEEWFRPLLTAYRAEISLAPDEIRSDREWGFVRGTYVVRVAPKAGGEFTEERGSFLDVVSRDRAGRWKIARAIWHSDNK